MAPGGLTGAALRLLIALATCVGALAVDARATPHRFPLIREPFDAQSIGSPADMCRNFYAYANGGHAEAVRSGSASLAAIEADLDPGTDNAVHQLLTTAIGTGRDARKLATFYRTCMDDAGIERNDLKPLAAELQAIEAMRQNTDVLPELARLHDAGVDAVFSFGPAQAYHASNVTIAEFGQADLGLPARELYLRSDADTRQIRTHYRTYVSALLSASGDRTSPNRVAAIVALETRLARASLSNTELHEPRRLDHPMMYRSVARLTPHLMLSRYLAAERVAATGTINVEQPALLTSIDRAVVDEPLRTWKDYLRLRLLDTYAPALSGRFSERYFNFHTALPEYEGPMPFPRWQRCVDSANQLLGDAVGAAYVKKFYPASLNSAAVALAIRIKAAFRAGLASAKELDAFTRRNALKKIDAMRLNVGYRHSRRSYGSFSVQLDSYAANVARGARYERRWELNTIGKRIDQNFAPDAQTLPQTANADSDLQRNEITVPAAMFVPPHFDAAGDDAANLGSMGDTIGHEMMHGFDDEGAQFDAAGRLRNWWSPRDLARKRRAERCVMNQYHRIDVGGEHYDGRLIAGEAIADLGGVRSGYRALQLALAQQRGKRLDGYTPEQRYFLAFAQSWGGDLDFDFGTSAKPALFDEHPLPRDRVNATLANLPAWYAAFGCARPAQPICELW